MDSILFVVLQWAMILGNFAGIYLTRQSRLAYVKMSAEAKDTVDDLRSRVRETVQMYERKIDQLEEEQFLILTNPGLYDLRDDPEQYKMYLQLLRKKD